MSSNREAGDTSGGPARLCTDLSVTLHHGQLSRRQRVQERVRIVSFSPRAAVATGGGHARWWWWSWAVVVVVVVVVAMCDKGAGVGRESKGRGAGLERKEGGGLCAFGGTWETGGAVRFGWELAGICVWWLAIVVASDKATAETRRIQ